jgi:hypothetical protein
VEAVAESLPSPVAVFALHRETAAVGAEEQRDVAGKAEMAWTDVSVAERAALSVVWIVINGEQALGR